VREKLPFRIVFLLVLALVLVLVYPNLTVGQGSGVEIMGKEGYYGAVLEGTAGAAVSRGLLALLAASLGTQNAPSLAPSAPTAADDATALKKKKRRRRKRRRRW